MGKKGSWSSALKRVFIPCSKHKLNESVRKGAKEKKKNGFGKLRHGKRTSFIHRFGEPSSIEKILADAERTERENQIIYRPPTPPPDRDEPRTPSSVPTRAETPTVSSPKLASPRRDIHHFDQNGPEKTISNHNALATEIPSTVSSPMAASPRTDIQHSDIQNSDIQHFDQNRPEKTISNHNALATEIPSTVSSPIAASPRTDVQHSGSSRPEPTLTNLNASATKIQAAYRGYMERKSLRALKGLARLQGLIRGDNVQRQTTKAMKQMQLLVRVQTQIQSRRIQNLENQSLQQQSNYKSDKDVESSSTLGKWTSSRAEDEWEDSVLTKEEVDAKMQRKVEAIIKRERAMAYAYSHKSTQLIPKPARTSLLNSQPGGFPSRWNWLQPQPTETQVARNGHITPPRSKPEQKLNTRPQSSHHKQHPFELDPFDAVTPKSTRSTFNFTPNWKQTRTPRRRSMKDDDGDSHMSCPPFSIPNYMTLTESAKAKAKSRAYSNPQDRIQGANTPNSESKRRLSLHSNESVGSFRWSNDGSSSRMVGKRQTFVQPSDNKSVDSRLSLPGGVARKPFNRFV